MGEIRIDREVRQDLVAVAYGAIVCIRGRVFEEWVLYTVVGFLGGSGADWAESILRLRGK